MLQSLHSFINSLVHNTWSFSVSLFPVPWALFGTTLIQWRQMTSFKPTVELLADQALSGLVNCFLFPRFSFYIPRGYIYTHLHTNTRVYKYQHALIYLFCHVYIRTSNFILPYNDWSSVLRNRSTWVRTPVALLCSFSDKYPWERYEAPYLPSYGLNSTTTVLLKKRIALALNNLQKLICH